jgi:hypothetical protein
MSLIAARSGEPGDSRAATEARCSDTDSSAVPSVEGAAPEIRCCLLLPYNLSTSRQLPTTRRAPTGYAATSQADHRKLLPSEWYEVVYRLSGP